MTRRSLQLLTLGLALVAATALVAAPVPAPAPAGKFDWPQWRGPDRTDVSKETGLLKEWPKEGPKLLWTFRDAGIGFSCPCIVGDHLFCMGGVEGKEFVYAIDLNTQKKVWNTEIALVTNKDHGDGPRGTLTVDGGLVFGLNDDGVLFCVKAADGDKVWTKELKGKDIGGKMMSGWGYSESPLVDGDKVVVTPGGPKGTVAAFDKKTGNLLWQSKDFTDEAAYSSLVPCEIGGVRQYVQMTGKSVAGIAAEDGKLLWKQERSGKVAAIPTPLVAKDLVYVTSGYGEGCMCIKVTRDSSGGFSATKVYANTSMVDHHGGVVLVGDHVYGHSDKGGWLCQDLATGKEVWSNRGVGKGSVTCADGKLYCYSEQKGEVALADVSPAGYKETGHFTIPEQTKLPRKSGQIWTHPVISNGKLYLRDQDLIFCYDIQAK
jgi:outer membrane protein assembly factor BamB